MKKKGEKEGQISGTIKINLQKILPVGYTRNEKYMIRIGLIFTLIYIFSSSVTLSQTRREIKDKAVPEFYKWAPTPPMGWNSWDCFGPTVVEDEVKANADYMAKNLRSYGWKYIVVDIRWYVENDKAGGYNQDDPVINMDDYGRLIPAGNRFPSSDDDNSFKHLADYIHKKGLKFGIHVMRGIPVLAVQKNTPIFGSNYTARDIYSTEGQCKWLRDMYTIDAEKPGAQDYYYSIIDLYASWGVDFLKIDDLSSPYHAAEIEMIRKAIDRTGREIVLSTSPGPTPLAEAGHIMQNANMWRTVGDFWDNWRQLKNEFDVCNMWAQYSGDGHYPDADMLPLGRIGIRAERGNPRMSGFTKDEQYTVMTLFSIFRSPLMFGGNLPDNDDFTLSLLNNRDVLYVNNHSIKNKQLFRDNNIIAWTAEDPENGDTFLALFNTADTPEPATVSVKFEQMGLSSTHRVKDLWTGTSLGKFKDVFLAKINSHGSGLYRIQK
jgi:alpha-galactosidase